MCNCLSCVCRQTISWKEAKSLLKLGNPAEYYRSFSTKERRMCHGGLCKNSKSKKQDTFVKVEIFQPCKDSLIILRGGATIEFTDGNIAYFKAAVCCTNRESATCCAR